MAVEYQYSHRHGTTEQWTNSTDILHNHEIGIEYAGNDIVLVFGDGVNTYANLKKVNLSKIEALETQMDGAPTQSDIPTKVSELANDSGYVIEEDLATVATSGDYNDLINKPTIPDNIDVADLAAIGAVFHTIKQDGYPRVGEWVELSEPETKKFEKEITGTTDTVGTAIADAETGVETTIYSVSEEVYVGFGRSNIQGEVTPIEGLYDFNYTYDPNTGIVAWQVQHDNPNQSVTIKFEYETTIYTYLRIK